MRARQLYELYRAHDGIDDLPADVRARLEQQVFRRPLEDVWTETAAYFERRDPAQLARAAGHPKRKAALVYRWYLGMASRWAKTGDADRAVDYQIWCGPAMGSFNSWVRGTYLAAPRNRRVADVARHLMAGAAYHQRLSMLRAAGLALSPALADYPVPQPAPEDGTLSAVRP
jgi:PfaD family protein